MQHRAPVGEAIEAGPTVVGSKAALAQPAERHFLAAQIKSQVPLDRIASRAAWLDNSWNPQRLGAIRCLAKVGGRLSQRRGLCTTPRARVGGATLLPE